VPGNCHALSVDWNSITVDRHEVSVQWKDVLVPNDQHFACSNSIRDQQDALSGKWKAISVQRNGVDHVAMSGSFHQDGVSVDWNPMPFLSNDGPANKNTNPVEGHTTPERRKTIPLDINGVHVGRNPMLVVQDSLREQLSSATKPLFIAKMVKFHQFRHSWFSYHSNHTHCDTPVTVHSIHFLPRRHNASFCSTQ
jgi:hypothetical protein